MTTRRGRPRPAIWPALVFACAAAGAAGIGASGGGGQDRTLYVHVKGLPAGADEKQVLLKAIRLRDGLLVSSARDPADSDVNLQVPAAPLILAGTYLTLSPRQWLEGSTASYPAGPGSEDAALPLRMLDGRRNTTAQAGTAKGLPAYPPERGKAIGYNPDDFTVSGPGAEPWMGRALAEGVAIDLAGDQCSGEGDNSYVVVESANPRAMALIEAELALQHGPGFDPRSAVTPHIVAATHLVRGGFTITADTFTADLCLVDRAGRVVAEASNTGPIANFWDTIDRAARALARDVCRGREWEGSISVEDHASATVPNPGSNQGGATSQSDLSVNCTFKGTKGTCSVSSSSTLSGNGVTIQSSASGTASTYAAVWVSSGTVLVRIGMFQLTGTHTVSLGGSTSTDQQVMTFGPYETEAPAKPDSASQSQGHGLVSHVITWQAKQ